MKILHVKKHNPLAKSFAESLSSLEAETEYQKLIIIEEILQSMKKQGILHDEMAERMGVTPAVLTSMQRATNPLKVEILVKAARALDMELQVRFVTKKSKARPESSID